MAIIIVYLIAPQTGVTNKKSDTDLDRIPIFKEDVEGMEIRTKRVHA